MPLEVTLRADAAILSRVNFGSGELITLTVKIPPLAHELWIDVPSWSPLQVGLSADDRTLGIAVRSIRGMA